MNNKPNKKDTSKWDTSSAYRATKEGRSDYGYGPKSSNAIYEKYIDYTAQAIKDGEGRKVLVLGATPELRDLILTTKATLASIDVSAEMMRKQTEVMESDALWREVSVIGNWLSTPFADQTFDYILGDAIMANVSQENTHIFVKELERLLRPGGHLLLREVITIPERQQYTMNQIIQKAHKEGWHKYDLWLEIYCYATDGARDAGSLVIQMKKLREIFEERIYNQGLLSAEEERYFKQYTQGELVSTFRTRAEIIRAITNYFEIVAESQSPTFRFGEYFRFYFMRKK